MSGKKKLLLTAALAAAMVLLTAAGYPYFQHLLVNGELSFQQTADGRITSFVQHGPLMEAEEDRLYFVPEEGQRLDITDLVSEETPYIYDGSDPDTGLEYYVVMGGTPECYGWFAWIQTPNPFYDGSDPETRMQTAYDFTLSNWGGYSGLMGMDHVEWRDEMNHPWLLAGAEQLGITFVEPPEEVHRVK